MSKTILKIALDSSMDGKVRQNLSSILDDDHYNHFEEKSGSTADVYITDDPAKVTGSDGLNILVSTGVFDYQDSKFENTLVVNLVDYESILNILKIYNERKLLGAMDNFKEDSRANLENLIKSGNSYLTRLQKRIVLEDIDQEKLNLEIQEFLEVYKISLELSIELSLFEKIEDFIQFILKNVKQLKLIKDIRLDKKENLEKYLPLDLDELLLPSPDGQESFIYCKFFHNCDLDRAYFLMSSLFFEIENYRFQKDRIRDVQTVNELWNSAFLNLPSPVALFSNSGELLLHNSLFTNLKILPKDCLKLENGEKLEVDKDVYSVIRKSIDLGSSLYDIFVFTSVNVNKERGNISSEELGIISSSIAHELNNPIAGILASISLLELDDHLDEEALQAIKDMKHSAKRCQELIKVFLGFSKATPARNIESAMFSSFQHAIELMRFRMIESSLRLEVEEKKDQGKFSGHGNSSIRAMIFYLILNEVLTLFSQKNLIAAESQNLIVGSFKEFPEQIEIDFNINLEKSTTISSSKLINHLLNLENLKIEIQKSVLTLKQNEVRLLL